MSVLRDLWTFLRTERKWWMLPLLLVVLLVGFVAVLGAAFPGLAPFLYPLG